MLSSGRPAKLCLEGGMPCSLPADFQAKDLNAVCDRGC